MVTVDAAWPDALAAGTTPTLAPWELKISAEGVKLPEVAGRAARHWYTSPAFAGGGVAGGPAPPPPAVELGGGNVIAAAARSGGLKDHHRDRAGDGGRPIIAAIDPPIQRCERQAPGFGVRVEGERPVVLCWIGGVDDEKETRAGVGQTRAGNAQQAEGHEIAGSYGELIGIDLAGHEGGDSSGEGTSAGEGGAARAVDPRQDYVEVGTGAGVGTDQSQGERAIREQIVFQPHECFARHAAGQIDRGSAGYRRA